MTLDFQLHKVMAKEAKIEEVESSDIHSHEALNSYFIKEEVPSTKDNTHFNRDKTNSVVHMADMLEEDILMNYTYLLKEPITTYNFLNHTHNYYFLTP